jgi:hypothetical protein
MTCGCYCSDDFLGLYNHKTNIIMGPIVNGCGVTGGFYCSKRLLVNNASQVTLRDLETAGIGQSAEPNLTRTSRSTKPSCSESYCESFREPS